MKHLFKFVILFLCLVINLTAFAKQPGYHDTDDKSAFYIPQNVDPLMMTNQQLEEFRIVKNLSEEDKNNPYIKHYIEKVEQKNRPLLPSDIRKAYQDRDAIYGIFGLDFALTDKGNGELGKLNEEQEKLLKRLQDEYGEDSEIFNESFKQRLSLYRKRQQHIQEQNDKFKKEHPHLYLMNKIYENIQ